MMTHAHSSLESLSPRYSKKRWNDFLTQDKDGVLHVEGVSVEHLARKYGTPHFILIEREIRERLRAFKQAFPYPKLRPQFACKVNSNLEIIRIAKEEGFELDASSVGEIILGLLADYKPNQITFTNLYKSHQDITFAAMIGVQAITADSMEELEKIAFVGEKLGLKINLFLRLNPLIDLGNYTTRYQQYGIPYPDAKKAVDYAMKHPHLELTGFHFHGSYISDPQVYVMAAQKLLKVVRYATDLGAKIKYLDLGGGFPPNDNSHPQYGKMYDLPEGGKKIVEGIQKLLQKYQLAAPYLIFEPGKHIVSNAMMALTKIVSEKNMGKNKMVILNGSVYNLVADIFVSKLTYHFLPANKMRQPRTERYRITGSTCDCIDVFSKGEAMPKLEKDDLLMIMDCGAYSEVFASNFNSLKRAPIILISPDGTTKLVRRRDRYAEMFAPQLDALKVADPNELKFFYNLHRINIEKIWNDKPELEKLKKPIKALLQSLQKNSAT
ncbi:MAG TPA: hypothetical protein VJG90_05375 [Candidatus Nanoarchaeia archaeon]|nr:hypothetical protein [Candidatus Nanoarchaeia archaeon]